MRLQAAVSACALYVSLTCTLSAQQPVKPSGEIEPDFRVRVHGYFDSDTLRDFGRRVRGYVELRDDLQTGLPTLRITIDPDEIVRAEKLLAQRIRAARATARGGEIFAPPIGRQIRKMLVVEVDEKTLAAITDDNPGEFRFRLNQTYPRDKPVSAVPPDLLGLLPALADDIEYRFVGRHLILRDVKANIIIDTIPYAISCRDCDFGDDDDDDDDDDDGGRKPDGVKPPRDGRLNRTVGGRA